MVEIRKLRLKKARSDSDELRCLVGGGAGGGRPGLCSQKLQQRAGAKARGGRLPTHPLRQDPRRTRAPPESCGEHHDLPVCCPRSPRGPPLPRVQPLSRCGPHEVHEQTGPNTRAFLQSRG